MGEFDIPANAPVMPLHAIDRSPDMLVEYLAELMIPWGGPKGFAKHWKEVFDRARKGSPTQLRALEKIVDVMKMIHDVAPHQKAVSEMSDEEIKYAVREIVQG